MPTAVPEILSNHPNFTSAKEQRVIENASLPGIAKVFNDYICGAVRRVTVQGDFTRCSHNILDLELSISLEKTDMAQKFLTCLPLSLLSTKRFNSTTLIFAGTYR